MTKHECISTKSHYQLKVGLQNSWLVDDACQIIRSLPHSLVTIGFEVKLARMFVSCQVPVCYMLVTDSLSDIKEETLDS